MSTSETKKHFAKNLKRCRNEAGFSQIQLAESLSYTSKSISKWETGAALPPAEVLPKIAKILHTDLNQLFDFREDPLFYLGIDGGSTKTHFMLTDLNGKVIRKLTLGACNPSSIDAAVAIEVVKSGITTICGDIPYGKISIFAGIAGCGIVSNRDLFKKLLEEMRFSRYGIDNNPQNIISVGLGKEDGVIAIMSTGSMIFTTINGNLSSIGGYGHYIGDVFSGSEFGRACVEAALYELDGSGPHTDMTKEVLAREISASHILSSMYKIGKPYLASFADILFAAAASGDTVANDILDRNIERFSVQLISALKKFPKKPKDKSIPVILAGDITLFSKHYLEKLKHAVMKKCNCEIKILDREPVVGALLMAGAPAVYDND